MRSLRPPCSPQPFLFPLNTIPGSPWERAPGSPREQDPLGASPPAEI